MRVPFLLITALLLMNIAGASSPTAGNSKPPASEVKSATTDTLLQLEADFMKAAAERGSGGYMSYYAEDSVELPNGGDILLGKIAIGKTMGFLDDKNNRLTWKPIGADISGDLGYTYGTYEFHSKDKAGKPVVEYGKYTTIWKHQKDGNWKVVLDMGNATPTAK